MEKTLPEVLIVNDDSALLSKLDQELRPWTGSFSFAFSEGGVSALRQLDQGNFSIVIADLDNANLAGEEFLERVRTQFPSCVRVVMSSRADGARPYAVADNDHFYLTSDATAEELIEVMRGAESLHRHLVEHPRELTAQELTEVVVEYFLREILHDRIVLDDIPKRVRPYISKELLRQSKHFSHEAVDVPDECWSYDTDWTSES